MYHEQRRGDPGFTLVELMVVSAIIGILVSIAVPTYTNARYVAESKSCQSNQRAIVGCMQAYKGDLGVAPSVQGGLLDTGGSAWYPILVSNYLLKHPECPSDHARYLLSSAGEILGDNGSTAGFKEYHQAP